MWHAPRSLHSTGSDRALGQIDNPRFAANHIALTVPPAVCKRQAEVA
jgi:hypothetical protein